MNISRIPFADVPQLSERDRMYAQGDERLSSFFKYPVELAAFSEVIKDRAKTTTDRQTLCSVLLEQHQSRGISAPQRRHIDALQSPHTFTIVTAHQPSLFTGPLYYIYKITSVLHLTQTLNEHYPDYQFVPVFVSGAEDHDFEEINHVRLFNKRLEWQSGEQGPVGAMKTATLQPILEELKEVLGNGENAVHIYDIIHRCHTENTHYGPAANALAHELFKDQGLLVLNMSDARLKRLFIPVLKEELVNQPSKALVDAEGNRLEEAGFRQQAMAREINLFYLSEQSRERIVFENGQYEVLNTSLHFSPEAMLQELEARPERFSPNVVMRPLYQELILPNLAYIGGGGELAYWMERQTQFDHFGINFPMLIRRNSVLWIDKGSSKKRKKLGLDIIDLFADSDQLVRQFVHRQSDEPLHLQEEKQQFQALFETIKTKATQVDPTLAKAVAAEASRQFKAVEQLEGRLVRAEKQKHETALQQIRGLKEKLFPANGLQERHDNFLAFYLRYGTAFFEVLREALDPLEAGFVVVEE
ncbi:MAG: bacillithiol biosynthesis cysteine-adding enzyme BshC [Bacteroidota bacterium]